MKWSNRSYEKVATSESEEHLAPLPSPRRRSMKSKVIAHFNLGFFIFNTLCFSALLWTTRQSGIPNAALKRVNSYSMSKHLVTRTNRMLT
jgi:hypothetical protein